MNLSETERFEVREILAREVLRVTEAMNRPTHRHEPNIDRLRWERIEFILAIREKLK